MLCTGYGMKGRAWNAVRKLATVFKWNPLVILSPQDRNGTADLAVSPLNLLRVFVVHLRDLAPESLLTFCSQPRCKIERHLIVT